MHSQYYESGCISMHRCKSPNTVVGLGNRVVGIGWLWGREIGFCGMLVHVR
jgi:hypothetical protein